MGRGVLVPTVKSYNRATCKSEQLKKGNGVKILPSSPVGRENHGRGRVCVPGTSEEGRRLCNVLFVNRERTESRRGRLSSDRMREMK